MRTSEFEIRVVGLERLSRGDESRLRLLERAESLLSDLATKRGTEADVYNFLKSLPEEEEEFLMTGNEQFGWMTPMMAMRRTIERERGRTKLDGRSLKATRHKN